MTIPDNAYEVSAFPLHPSPEERVRTTSWNTENEDLHRVGGVVLDTRIYNILPPLSPLRIDDDRREVRDGGGGGGK